VDVHVDIPPGQGYQTTQLSSTFIPPGKKGTARITRETNVGSVEIERERERERGREGERESQTTDRQSSPPAQG
jgi:hypothetical protein